MEIVRVTSIVLQVSRHCSMSCCAEIELRYEWLRQKQKTMMRDLIKKIRATYISLRKPNQIRLIWSSIRSNKSKSKWPRGCVLTLKVYLAPIYFIIYNFFLNIGIIFCLDSYYIFKMMDLLQWEYCYFMFLFHPKF